VDQTVEKTLLTVGIACIVAAIVGGGFEAFGIKIPLLNSKGRQVALAALGAVLVLVWAFPYFLRTATISGKVFDIDSNQGISGVRLTLVDKSGNIVEEDIFTTAQDGVFQFALPRGVDKGQLPLHFQLGRRRWVGSYLPDEKITDLSSDRQLNLPVDLAGLSTVAASTTNEIVSATDSAGASASISKPGRKKNDELTLQPSVTPNIGEKTVLETGTIRILVRGSPGYLDFELHVRPTDWAALDFDENKNDAVDANVDVHYGEPLDTGKPCTQYRLAVERWSFCGVLNSESTVSVRPGLDAGVPVKIIVWHIPKKEINAENGDAHFTVMIYNEATKGLYYYPSKDFSQTFRTL
jgi:hypothetical protein